MSMPLNHMNKKLFGVLSNTFLSVKGSRDQKGVEIPH